MSRTVRDINRENRINLSSRFGIEINRKEANRLRTAAMTLNRWSALQCGVDAPGGGTLSIEQDEDTGVWTRSWRGHQSGTYTRIDSPQRDLETVAKKRISDTLAPHGLVWRHQTDPRGEAVYIRRAGESMDFNFAEAGLLLVTT